MGESETSAGICVSPNLCVAEAETVEAEGADEGGPISTNKNVCGDEYDIEAEAEAEGLPPLEEIVDVVDRAEGKDADGVDGEEFTYLVGLASESSSAGETDRSFYEWLDAVAPPEEEEHSRAAAPTGSNEKNKRGKKKQASLGVLEAPKSVVGTWYA